MDNSLLVSLSQQLAAYQSMDVIANNIANASTPGYRREAPTFHEYVARVRPSETQKGLQSLSFVEQTGTIRHMAQGALESTSAPFDLAINGKGYFVVQTPAGERYTRNGHFTLDADGQIVSGDGYPLQGEGGAITITPDDGDIHVGADGVVSGRNGQIAKLRVAGFRRETEMAKEGASLYSTSEPPATPADFKISQGALESSNVAPVIEISHMIEIMRAYQATATMTQSHEDLLRQAIDKLGQQPNS
jgi:flagellar basal-body rod protein FlgF